MQQRQAAALPTWVDVGLLPLLNLVIALFISGLVVLLIGENPLEALGLLLKGALGTVRGISYVFYYATSFIFTGLAVAVALHAGQFNIGAEGQAYIAGVGATAMALALSALGAVPVLIVLPLTVVAAMVFGAFWAWIAGILYAKRGCHIVITTIMLNYIAASLVAYLIINWFRPLGVMAMESRTLPVAYIPSFREVGLALGYKIPNTPLNLSVILAFLAAWAVWYLLWRTRLGYELRTVGASPQAAIYAGIRPGRITVVAMMISGALAGLVAVNEILGVQHRLILDFVGGAGFVGIAVALMGRAHPVGIILSALLFGLLYQGGAELAFAKPAISRYMIVVIQGLVILFMGAMENGFKPWISNLFARQEA